MITFALDTNIISYLLKDDDAVFEKYRGELKKGNDCVIPPVAYYEIKRGLLVKNAISKTKAFEYLCSTFKVGTMNTEILDKAAHIYARLRQKGNLVEDADLFIAAFCIVNDYTLVTNNTKHFSLIDGLRFVNWKT